MPIEVDDSRILRLRDRNTQITLEDKFKTLVLKTVIFNYTLLDTITNVNLVSQNRTLILT